MLRPHAPTLVKEVTRTCLPSPPLPVHRLFEAFATKQPTAIAATFQDALITYGELEERANRLAHCLVAYGVGPETPVAVFLRPSLDALVAMLAILKARGLYLPLDPTHPEALLSRMLEEARPLVVLTHSTLSGLIPADRSKRLCFDTDKEILAAQPRDPPILKHSFDDAAYLFYTSGTTGKPRGVVATQGNLAHYIHVAQEKYAFGAGDVFCSLARGTFSISLFELLSPLCCGGSLRLLDRDDVLTPDRLCRALEDVTVLHAGPSLLGGLFRHIRATPSAPRAFPRMRHASTGGDMVPPSIAEEMKRVFENAEIYVIYGCTEIGCMGTTFPVSRERKITRTLVGKPFADVQLRVLDSNRLEVPFGEVGEICFAGKGIVRGYLEQPELTTEKFVAIDGVRFYLTGDMGRLHADGNLEILGRRDFQVQLRGIRIELAGIETTVLELGLAVQCAVVCKSMGEGDARLVAFVVQPSVPSVASFRGALATELPDYMLPHHVVVLEAMPLTANGKLDRRRLQEMPWDTQLGTKGQTAPENELERELAGVFCRVLGISDVGVDDSFFDLGGDSLRAMLALQEIENTTGFAVPAHVLFACGTVRALAGHVRDSNRAELRPILLSDSPARPPLFMLSGIHIYRELARRMGGAYSVYGVFVDRDVQLFDPASGRHSVKTLARDYVEILRRAQPMGPYRLLGYSFAGIVAYEVAQQLRDAGEEVRFLALVDSELPEWTTRWKFRLAEIGRMWSASPRDLLAFASRRLRDRFGAARPELAWREEDARLAPLEEQRDMVNRHAAAEYMAQIVPFAGSVTVITASKRLRGAPLHSPSCGWASYVSALDVHAIDADHRRLMRDEPYVSQMAEVLVEGMRRAEAV